MNVFKIGFLLGIGLIIGLGPQNIYILRQGILKNHAFWAASSALVCDMILVTLSLATSGLLATAYPSAKMALMLAGAVFLFGYGMLCLLSGIRALKGTQPSPFKDKSKQQTIRNVVLTTLAFSFLNPQAIIDTFVLIGGFGVQFQSLDRWRFAAGVLVASCCWFYCITTIATLFSERLQRATAWGTLELVSGFIMMAFSLRLIGHSACC